MRFEELIKSVQEMPVVRQMIPLNVQMGFPVLKQWNGEVLALFPYYAVKIIDKEIWMSHPLFYAEVSYPGGRLTGIQDCRYSCLFGDLDYNNYAGVFTKGRGEGAAIYQENIKEYTTKMSAFLEQSRQGKELPKEDFLNLYKMLMEIAEQFHQPFYKRWFEL